MTNVIGVRFRREGKTYYFSPGEHEFEKGDHVIVETVHGVEYGEVAMPNKEMEDEKVVQPLKPIIRPATEEDAERNEDNHAREKEASKICREKIRKFGLEMKLVATEYTFDRAKLLFYFTADGRIDFRELVKDLASVFHTRIELRQIGVRDETRMKGGLGICGRELCCSTFLTNFNPVSIRMAKDQNLSLNPTKISGTCGRLMCCLKNEEETYQWLNAKMPKVGEYVATAEQEEGKVASINILKQTARVVFEHDDEKEIREYPVDELTFKGKRRSKDEPRKDESKKDEAKGKKPSKGQEYSKGREHSKGQEHAKGQEAAAPQGRKIAESWKIEAAAVQRQETPEGQEIEAEVIQSQAVTESWGTETTEAQSQAFAENRGAETAGAQSQSTSEIREEPETGTEGRPAEGQLSAGTAGSVSGTFLVEGIEKEAPEGGNTPEEKKSSRDRRRDDGQRQSRRSQRKPYSGSSENKENRERRDSSKGSHRDSSKEDSRRPEGRRNRNNSSDKGRDGEKEGSRNNRGRNRGKGRVDRPNHQDRNVDRQGRGGQERPERQERNGGRQGRGGQERSGQDRQDRPDRQDRQDRNGGRQEENGSRQERRSRPEGNNQRQEAARPEGNDGEQ